MYYVGTDLRRMCHVAAAVWQHSPPAVLLMPEGRVLLLYGALELLSLWLYVRLYASDPGGAGHYHAVQDQRGCRQTGKRFCDLELATTNMSSNLSTFPQHVGTPAAERDGTEARAVPRPRPQAGSRLRRPPPTPTRTRCRAPSAARRPPCAPTTTSTRAAACTSTTTTAGSCPPPSVSPRSCPCRTRVSRPCISIRKPLKATTLTPSLCAALIVPHVSPGHVHEDANS